MKSVTKTAKTKEEALKLALEELGCSEEQAEVLVLDEGSKGFFGLGARDARVKVTMHQGNVQEEPVLVIEGRRRINRKLTEESAAPENITEKPQLGIEVAEGGEDVKVFLEEVTRRMGHPAEVSQKSDENAYTFILSGEHMGALIGRRGDTLDALQYLANIMMNKNRTGERKRVVLDSEGYRSRREETLNSLAKRLAGRVRRTGKKVVLEPMSPVERRMIHTALQNVDDVKTFSEGEEPYRRLVIAPAAGAVRQDNAGQAVERPRRPVEKKPVPSKKWEGYDKPRTPRPPKRSYDRIEDVDGKSGTEGEESSLW